MPAGAGGELTTPDRHFGFSLPRLRDASAADNPRGSYPLIDNETLDHLAEHDESAAALAPQDRLLSLSRSLGRDAGQQWPSRRFRSESITG